MFDFRGSPVPVRPDLRSAYLSTWSHFARPGPTLTGDQRVALLSAMRNGTAEAAGEWWWGPAVGDLGAKVYAKPKALSGEVIRAASEEAGDPSVVEVIALGSMLAAIDGTHRALGADLEPLPESSPGEPTGTITEGLQRRRTHIPVPPGPIPVMLDLLPDEGVAFQALFGPQYMTDQEMASSTFRRSPGLDRAQMEIVSSRTSIHNECFY